MRARNLKPDFFKNEKLAELPPLTRLLFQAYWCMADSRGVVEYRPKRIKAEALPYDNCDIHDMTLQLVTCNFLQLHEIPTGEQFIKVVNFEKHQHPHPNEVKRADQPYKVLENNESFLAITCNDKSLTSQASSLNPSSLNPSSISLCAVEKSTDAKMEKPTKNTKRGERLTPDWKLSQEMGEWAEQQGLDSKTIIQQRDSFRDYWIAKAGEAGVKLDWDATWRNWIRKYIERGCK